MLVASSSLLAVLMLPTAGADAVQVMNGTLPTASYLSSSVWDGSNAYVFGGTSCPPAASCVALTSIVRYNPTNDGITAMSPTLPAGGALAAVWDGSSAHLFGGAVWNNQFQSYMTTNVIARYDPASNTVTQAGTTLPTPLQDTSAVWDGQNVYLFGGQTGAGPTDRILRYNPAGGTVAIMGAALPTPRTGTSAVWDGSNAYIFGGRGDEVHSQILRYNPTTDTITVMNTTLPTTRVWTSAIWDGSNAYIFGGSRFAEFNTNLLDQIVRYNPLTDTITTMNATLPGARWGTSAVWDGSNAYIFGGKPSSSNTNQIVRYGPAPKAPSGLAATRGPDAIKITLTWTPPGGTLTGYHVFRSTASGGQGSTPIGTALTPQYIDTAITPGQTYYYKVAAYNDNGDGDLSAEVSQAAPTVPTAPLSPSAQIGLAPGQIRLSWQAPASGGGLSVTNYTIYRGDTSGQATTVVAVVGPVLAWNDASIPNGARRFYRISATNLAGEGPLSLEVNATAPNVPTAPRNPIASLPAPNEIRLTWQVPFSDGGLAISGYRVHCGTASGALSECATLGLVSEWTDTGLANGAQRFYQVSAFNAAGEGARTAELSARAADVPTAPLNLVTQRGPGPGQIRLDWNAPTSNGGLPVTGYVVERAIQAAGPFTPAAQVGNVLTWTDTALPNGAVRHYRVAAINAVGTGPFSTVASGQAPDRPTAAAGLAGAPGPLPGQVSLTWQAPQNNGMPVTSYAIYRTTVDGGQQVRVVDPNGDNVFVDTGRIPGVRYYYQIAAINGIGEGAKSPAATARAALLPPTLPTPIGDAGDQDGDLVPDLLETRVCGTLLIENLMTSPVYQATGPLIGTCASTADWDPLVFYDSDDDMVLDAVESAMCLIEDRNTPVDGICVGAEDYGLPPG